MLASALTVAFAVWLICTFFNILFGPGTPPGR